MSWYRTGAVTVTAGSAVVTGAGTDFVRNVSPGEAMIGPDLRVYEVQSVVSATVLTLIGNYIGASAGGQPFAILPTQSFARDLALGAAELLNTFSAVRDGIGQGFVADGTATTPGLRFTADQDTGFFRPAPNCFSVATGGVGRMTLDAAGALLVGAASGSSHLLAWGTAQGQQIVQFSPLTNTAYGTARFYLGAGFTPAGPAACFFIDANSSTNRSINAAGTVNASGADYAEYMTKATGCGTIAAGDVCGVDRDGKLTRTWADAVSFVVKSTDPAYVGGDSWAAHLPPRPDGPGDDLAAWEQALEEARWTVDRIAFSGQVPVNVAGDFAVGDYLIAAANGGGIQAVAVAEADITFDQYRRRLGKVWAIRDGRPWVDVQHG